MSVGWHRRRTRAYCVSSLSEVTAPPSCTSFHPSRHHQRLFPTPPSFPALDALVAGVRKSSPFLLVRCVRSQTRLGNYRDVEHTGFGRRVRRVEASSSCGAEESVGGGGTGISPERTHHSTHGGDMKRIIIMGAVIATTLTLLGSTAASAAVAKRLHFDTCSTSDSIGWARGTDSPLDGNHQALLATVGSDNGANPPYNCAEAYSYRTQIEGKSLDQVRNLSFDYLAADSAGHGGAPRISVLMRDGTPENNLVIAYLT